MYAVFTSTLLTKKSKYLVRNHERDYNIRDICQELLEHIFTSTKASDESSTILTHIITATFGSGAWKGSSELFILH